MKRSVILMGGKTFVLSLPSQWVKKYSIQKGEELDLEERGNSLLVRTDRSSLGKEVELDFSALDKVLGRAVGAIYKAGYAKAKIHFQTREQLQKIEETLQRTLIGFEITKQEKNYVIVENLVDLKSEEFDASLKRLFYSLEMMHEDLISALSSQDAVALQKVIEKDGQVNRLADFCRRVINSGQTKLLEKPGVLYYIVEQLERIGDMYKSFAQMALTKEVSLSSESKILFLDLQNLFIQYRTLFYKFDLEGFEQFGKNFYSLREKIKTLSSQKLSSEQKNLLIHQNYLLETVIDMNGALLTMHI